MFGHELDIHLAHDFPSNTKTSAPLARDHRRGASVMALGSLFGLLYFVQGIVEPTDGLLSQPIKSLLRNWGYSAASTAWFIAALSVAWAVKPLYGLLTDFVPLAGSRRRSYLLLTTAVASISLTTVPCGNCGRRGARTRSPSAKPCTGFFILVMHAGSSGADLQERSVLYAGSTGCHIGICV